MPIYRVTQKIPEKVTAGKADRLVKADNRAQALRHVAEDTISVDMPTQDDLVVLVGSGVRVENAQDPANPSLGSLPK